MMSPVLLIAVVAALALVLTALLTPAVRGAAIAGGMVRQVQADRWHRRPTPAIGGVAIYLGLGLALGVGYLLGPVTVEGLTYHAPHAVLPWSVWEGLVMGATVAFLVGLVDDFVRLPPIAKLIGQLAAASVLLLSGIGVWLTGWYPADAVISLFWFVAITNAMNLLDNMDGLAAGIAAIAGGYLTLLFWLDGSMGMALLALGLTAALIGFLAHNYPPARIFMGDSGSLFLGLFLAGLALAPAPGASRSLAAVLAAPVLILGVPILDTTLVTVGRFLEGRPVSQGGKDHTSHRFVDLGMPEKRALWLLWGIALVGGGVGVLLRSAERGTALLFGGILVGVLTLVGAYLLSVRLRALEDRGVQGLSLYRFVVASQERYPVFALLLDGVWFVLAYYAAYLIRWDPSELPAQLPYLERTVAIWVGVKLVAFVVSGTYSSRWPTFGLYDATRVLRSNVIATLLAAGTLFVIERVGLSRGVVAIDFLVCSILTVGGRLSFRLLEGATQRWSETGTPAVILATLEEAELAVRQIQRQHEPRLRPVAVASPTSAVSRSRLGQLPLFGGQAALRHALGEAGATTVVLVDNGNGHSSEDEALRSHLATEGAVDVFVLEVRLHRQEAVEG